MNETDQQLLQHYAKHRAEDVFAELVRRHLDLVYSAALRQVQSPQLAKDVSQSVFADLARSAGSLKPDTILSAWLYEVTRRTAIDAIRKEARRQLREQLYTEMNAINATSEDWQHIVPHLDEAMAELASTDRAAVLLRFFENRSLREVGQELGVSDDAAQKRVSRAVERLREYFAKHGVTVGAGGLVAIVSANAVQAAPAGLAITISTAAALTGITLAATATITATKAVAMTTLQKTMILAATAAFVGGGIYIFRETSELRAQNRLLWNRNQDLIAQISDLKGDKAASEARAAALRLENERLRRNTAELPRLRAERARISSNTERSAPTDMNLDAVAKAWLSRVDQMKQFAETNPSERIPEFMFLTESDWLNGAEQGPEVVTFEHSEDYDRAMQSLRFFAEDQFARRVTSALRRFAEATGNDFPSSLDQFQPYMDQEAYKILQELYEIRPAEFIPEGERNKMSNTRFDAFITRKSRISQNTTSRLAIWRFGTGYWQSRP